jgi:flavodoxin I
METKCILVYASMSGNTKRMAKAIAEAVNKAAGCDIEVKEMYSTDAEVLEAYDSILLGSSTWGDGQLPDEALDFYKGLDRLNLRGKTAAVFGSGDSCYDDYGAAVDLLKHKLWEKGADVVLDGFKVELSPTAEELEECRRFGSAFVEQSSYYDK